MAKKTKKPLPRRAKPKAKAVKRPKPKRAVAPRKMIARKKAGKPESTLEKIENALMVGVADVDDVALSLGLLAAPLALSKRRQKSRKKRR
jgi:hypothetical protein